MARVGEMEKARDTEKWRNSDGDSNSGLTMPFCHTVIEQRK